MRQGESWAALGHNVNGPIVSISHLHVGVLIIVLGQMLVMVDCICGRVNYAGKE